ncbi:MAG: class I SAM-dependent methyltransferase [Opitutaceae bacterium]
MTAEIYHSPFDRIHAFMSAPLSSESVQPMKPSGATPLASLLCTLTLDDLAAFFGAPKEEIQRLCGEELSRSNLRYRRLDPVRRDVLLLEIMQRIDSLDLPRAGKERQGAWENGWQQNLDEFIRSGHDLDALVPKYFKQGVPVRLLRDYVIPEDPNFVLNFTRLFRTWLFRRYLSDAGSIYEFGCGPASHLAWLAQEFPKKKLYGFDWARPSQAIIREMAGHYGWNISGGYFDLFAPPADLTLDPQSTVYTFGALEQVGTRHEDFLQFLLRARPALCVHVECVHEFYDEGILSDYLALKYHKRRKYLDGYLTRLRELDAQGRVEIIRAHHQQFGNLYDDSHSLIVWRPRVPQ